MPARCKRKVPLEKEGWLIKNPPVGNGRMDKFQDYILINYLFLLFPVHRMRHLVFFHCLLSIFLY